MKDEKTQVRLNRPLVAILAALALTAAVEVLYWNDARNDVQRVSQATAKSRFGESSHHRMGLLMIPATARGVPVIGPETEAIELELKGIGIPARVFHQERMDWQQGGDGLPRGLNRGTHRQPERSMVRYKKI